MYKHLIAPDANDDATLWKIGEQGEPVAIIRQCDNPYLWNLCIADRFATYDAIGLPN